MLIQLILALTVSTAHAFELPFASFFKRNVAAASDPKIKRGPINGWEEKTVQKGFILSNDLYYKRLCRNVWKEQIPAFKGKNPQVKNVDKFWPGDKITIQTCAAAKEAMAKATTKKKRKKKKAVVQETVLEFDTLVAPALLVDVTDSGTVEEVKEQEADANKSSSEEIGPFDGSLFVGVGFLTETHNSLSNSGMSATFRIKSNILPVVSHRLIMDGYSNAIFVRNKLDFKANLDNMQVFISPGIGNRIGFKKNTADIRLSDNITNYAEVSVGINSTYGKGVNVTLETGVTVNSNYPINFSVIATKKLGNTPYSLGGYFDYVWTDSSVLSTDTNDRRMVTGGIIFSY